MAGVRSRSIREARTMVKDIMGYTKITDKKRAAYKQLSSLFHTIIGATNDIANTTMLDAVNEIKKTKYYRHEVKRACKESIRRYEVFDKKNLDDMRSSRINKQQIYMDYLDSVNDRLHPHVFKLYMAIKQVLDRKSIPESSLKAMIHCADQLLSYSIFLFDDFFRQYPPIPPIDIRQTFISARLAPCLNAWDTVRQTICKDCAEIDFAKDKNCKLAFDVIERNMTSETYINQSGKQALNLNPDVQLELDKEEITKKKNKSIELSDLQKQYLTENYATTTNKELSDKLGISQSTLQRIRKELNLSKHVV